MICDFNLDNTRVHGDSREDLKVYEHETNNLNYGWHRSSDKHGWGTNDTYTGHTFHYQRQRHPSGPSGDVEAWTVNTSSGPLRPNEPRGRGHEDWSRGCAGWRQRSYSGSEQSDNVSTVSRFLFLFGDIFGENKKTKFYWFM